jgi:hypothetical protein
VISADASTLELAPRRTPVVPASESTTSSPLSTTSSPLSTTSSPLEDAVPDLFGPDSFGPAPGEVIDASLLDPGVATVPPKASAMPKGALPDNPGIPSEAFKVPQAPAPPADAAPPAEEKGSRVGVLLLLFVLVLATAGVAAWQLGLTDGFVDVVGPYLGLDDSTTQPAAERAAPPVPVKAADAEPVPAEAADAAEPAEAAAVAAPEASANAAAAAEAEKPVNPALVKLKVISVPKGAFVSVNGKGAGRTPLTLEYAPGTKLSLFSKARGFLPRRQQVVVDQSQAQVKLVLSPLPYVLEVVTDPPGASASAVGGGQVTTPGKLTFRSMPASRKVVISKDGYVSVTKSMGRSSFVEEKSRMSASIKVTLAKDDASAPAEPASAAPVEAVTPSEPKAPEPVEVKEEAAAPTPAAPEPVEAPAPPSEPTTAAAP